MNILGIETTCDDTSLAVYSTERGVLSNRTANQLVHEKYGGVVPELASRQHIRNVLPVFKDALEEAGIGTGDIDGIGVSNGPGLVGSLLVGVGFAKALGLALGRPVVGVHHIEAHILSNELAGEQIRTPSIALVVSGGHTSLYRILERRRYKLVGNTRDDAAGECFDKVAKLLDLGFPGGPLIERAAQDGRLDAIDFPRAMMERGNFEFSFSGLKTAVRLHVEKQGHLSAQAKADIAASAQEAIVDPLVHKTISCARHFRARHVYLAGGVAANKRLRQRLEAACAAHGMTYHAPLLQYCTDNGAMVAYAALHNLQERPDERSTLDVFTRGAVDRTD